MKLFKTLKKVDKFGYRYELGFKGSETYRTHLGGCFTLIIALLILWQSVNSLSIMVTYNNDSV